MPTNQIVKHGFHCDLKCKNYGFLYYINSNDGFTELSNSVKIESIENRGLFFNASELHRSTSCTTPHGRININFNYL